MDETKRTIQADEEQQEVYVKQGRNCGGCLCDMRRAVIILSALGIIFSVVTVLSNRFFIFDNAEEELVDNPEDSRRLEDLFRLHIGLTILAIIGYTFAIFGGLKFKERLITVNIIIIPIAYIVTTTMFFAAAGEVAEFNYSYTNIIGPTIGFVMSLYVNVSFLREMRGGIMTEENYPNEEQSCCCV